MLWSWKHTILTHYGLHSAYGVDANCSGKRPADKSKLFYRICATSQKAQRGEIMGYGDDNDLGLLPKTPAEMSSARYEPDITADFLL